MQSERSNQRAWLLLALALVSVGLAALPAGANTCTLADHIRSANTKTSIGGCPQGTSHDVITLTEDFTLSEALPPITGAITIEGNGHTISGGDKFRIFTVNGGRLTLRNLTLWNGRAVDEVGGAIAMQSDSSRLTVESSSFLGNSADSDGGAIYVHGNATITGSSFLDNHSTAGYGGAVYADLGVGRIENSTFHNNQAEGGGVLGIWRADFTITHVTMVNNRATIRRSNAIDNRDGIVKLRNSIIVRTGTTNDCYGVLAENFGNLSVDGRCGARLTDDPLQLDLVGRPAYFPLRDNSPAIDAAHPKYCLATDQIGAPRPHGRGCDIGAIETTTARPPDLPVIPPPACPLADQITAANTDAPAGGCPAGRGHDIISLTGDINLSKKLPAITSNITIEGNGFSIGGRTRFRIFTVSAGTLTIKNLTLSDGNNLQGRGGAILVRNNAAVVVSDSVFVDNIALFGGAIAIEGGARLTVNSSQFVTNRAGIGGALYASSVGKRVTIANSSFIRNSAIHASVLGAGIGGAILAELSGQIDVSNSTFINNRAKIGGSVASRTSRVTLTHVTVLDNSGKEKGLYSYDNGAIRLRNSIVAANAPTSSALCAGRLAQNISNLISDGSCDPAYQGDPLLGEQTGDAAYLPLRAGSPAIDAADARFCPATDQAGNPRPQGGGCDIGAIETGLASGQGTGCRVTTTEVLNFRDGPGGRKIGLVAKDAAVTAFARTEAWFQVVYRGRIGWISADYVATRGQCG